MFQCTQLSKGNTVQVLSKRLFDVVPNPTSTKFAASRCTGEIAKVPANLPYRVVISEIADLGICFGKRRKDGRSSEEPGFRPVAEPPRPSEFFRTGVKVTDAKEST